MIDSISIYTEKKIKIKRNTQIQIQKQKSLNDNTFFNYHLFEYISGEPVLGSRAYGNIRDNHNRVLIKIDKKNGYCFFQFSLPFISSGENNLNSLSEKEAKMTFQKVQNLLHQNGFIIPDIFNEDSFTINRMAVFFLKHPFKTFIQFILSGL